MTKIAELHFVKCLDEYIIRSGKWFNNTKK